MSGNINCLKVNTENKEHKQYVHEVQQTPPTSLPPSKLERISLNPRYSIGTENLYTYSIWTRISNDLLHGQIWTRLSNNLLHKQDFSQRYPTTSTNMDMEKMKYKMNSLLEWINLSSTKCSCKLSKGFKPIWMLEFT